MRTLECIIFNVDHGFCSFIKSPNRYGLLVDCGCRKLFSPIKWVRMNYNFNKANINYFKERRISQAFITHLHLDHFEDIGSFNLNLNDKPKVLCRDKSLIKFLDEKISEENDFKRRRILTDFRKFQAGYSEDFKDKIDWGFSFFKYKQISVKDAEEASSKQKDKIINNRSYIIGVEFAGKKILFTGDMEVEGWKKAFNYQDMKEILSNTNFFITSHHGHKSGFTNEILNYSGKPDIYIVSGKRGDSHVDTSYSKQENSNGLVVKGNTEKSYMISTKTSNKSIKIVIRENGENIIEFIDTPDNLSEHQKKIIHRETGRTIQKW